MQIFDILSIPIDNTHSLLNQIIFSDHYRARFGQNLRLWVDNGVGANGDVTNNVGLRAHHTTVSQF